MDDIDRKIVNVLQIRPRAPWNLVGSVTGVDPATAARRWQRLQDAGAAWITCYPFIQGQSYGSLIELTCEPGRLVDVAVTLAGDHNVSSVNVKAGGHDVLAEVGAASLRDSARYSLTRLGSVPGIRSVRTLPIARIYTEAIQWRLRALDREAVSRLEASLPEPAQPTASSLPLSDGDWEVMRCLADNPRMSLSELGERLGVSPSTARRRLAAVADGRVRLRCELARSLTEWPVYATFFVNCPAERIAATGRALAKIPEVRAIFSLIGPFNLSLALWLRSVQHIQEFESQLSAKAPYVSIADRSLVLRPVKQMGQLLDEDGWRIGSVPMAAPGKARRAATRSAAE
jgi:DNA-binding Lrp family transcriptional regulator